MAFISVGFQPHLTGFLFFSFLIFWNRRLLTDHRRKIASDQVEFVTKKGDSLEADYHPIGKSINLPN
jgi:hypothetical protein